MDERYVLLGDVVNSRAIEDREAFQGRLREACAAVSEAYAVDVDAGLDVLKGVDEVGAVLDRVRHLYDVVDEFAERLRPQRVRLAVARGAIDVGGETVAEMDGPAFQRADRVLARIEDEDALFGFEADDDVVDPLIEGQVELLLVLKGRRSEREREVVRRYDELGTQAAVAEALGVSQPAVSKTLDRALYAEVRTLEGRLRRALEAYDE
jgi:hypothetical protein